MACALRGLLVVAWLGLGACGLKDELYLPEAEAEPPEATETEDSTKPRRTPATPAGT